MGSLLVVRVRLKHTTRLKDGTPMSASCASRTGHQWFHRVWSTVKFLVLKWQCVTVPNEYLSFCWVLSLVSHWKTIFHIPLFLCGSHNFSQIAHPSVTFYHNKNTLHRIISSYNYRVWVQNLLSWNIRKASPWLQFSPKLLYTVPSNL